LAYFSPFSLGCVQIGTVPELAGAQVFGYGTNPLFDVVSAQVNWSPLHADAPYRNVNMGMFSIEMTDGNPFQGNSDMLSELFHQIARQAREVKALAEFRRDDDLPHALVPRSLPRFEPTSDIDSGASAVESRPLIRFRRRSRARHMGRAPATAQEPYFARR
jgi:hypothetical protein